MSKITQIIEDAKDVKPIAEKSGTKVFSFDDYTKAVQKELVDGTEDTGLRAVNPDGSIARSRVVMSGVNENVVYGNLGYVKKTAGVGSDELWLALQAVTECYEFVANPQYTPHKQKVFVFKTTTKGDSKGEIYLDKTMMIDGADARQKLVHSYKEDLIKTCLALIEENGQGITKEESPF